MTVKDLKEFIFENYCKRINFTKKNWNKFALFTEKGQRKMTW